MDFGLPCSHCWNHFSSFWKVERKSLLWSCLPWCWGTDTNVGIDTVLSPFFQSMHKNLWGEVVYPLCTHLWTWGNRDRKVAFFPSPLWGAKILSKIAGATQITSYVLARSRQALRVYKFIFSKSSNSPSVTSILGDCMWSGVRYNASWNGHLDVW